jgi:hypothetical protein
MSGAIFVKAVLFMRCAPLHCDYGGRETACG